MRNENLTFSISAHCFPDVKYNSKTTLYSTLFDLNIFSFPKIDFCVDMFLRFWRSSLHSFNVYVRKLLWISDPVRPCFLAITSSDLAQLVPNLHTLHFSPSADCCQYGLLSKIDN